MNGTKSPFRWGWCAAALLVCVSVTTAPSHAVSYHVIICGSGGETGYQDKFREWGLGLRSALTDVLGIMPDRVSLLLEPLPGNPQSVPPTSLENIRDLFSTLAETLTSGDDLYVYIIGHGSYLKRKSKLHIPGPDLEAEQLEDLLSAISSRRQVVLNTTASSAGFINVLTGAGRVVCSATKSVEELNATEFMEFFIEGLREGGADRNYDERITFLEACEYAAEVTATWYLGENLIATEHAILDDNADGLGSRLPLADAAKEGGEPGQNLPLFDGDLAGRCFLKDFQFSGAVPQSLVDAYLAILDEITVLKKAKKTMDRSLYYAKLEEVLVRAARKNLTIHELSASDETGAAAGSNAEPESKPGPANLSNEDHGSSAGAFTFAPAAFLLR